MSFLSYNGVVLELVKTNQFLIEPQYSKDKMDYINTKITIDVTCVFNPQATTYLDRGGQIYDDAAPPAVTLNTIRRLLNQNRGLLIFAYGNTVVIQSPLNGPQGTPLATDCNGGPEVVGVSVQPIGEAKTFMVGFAVTTWIDDCTGFLGIANPSVLASNRWQTTHVVDDRHYTRIITQGVAIFRLDALAAINLPADHFRDVLLPAIPVGFRRMVCHITPASNQAAIAYEVVDQQMPYSLGSINSLANGLTPAKLGVIKFEGRVIVGSTPMQDANGGAQAIAGPMNVAMIDVSVWGNANSSRGNMILFASKLVVERLGVKALDPKLISGPIIRSAAVTELIHDQFINLRVEAWFAAGDGKNQGNVLGLGTIWRNWVGFDAYPDTFPGDANSGNPGGLHPQMPKDVNSRGTWNGEIICQQLTKACHPVYLNNNCVFNDGVPDDNYTTCQINIYKTPKIEIPTNPNRYRNVTGAIWTQYSSQNNYRNLTNKKAVPITGRKKDGTTTSTSGGTGGGGPVTPVAQPGGGGSTGSSGDAPLPVDIEIITLARPINTLTCEWTCERVGDHPLPPQPDPPDESWVLLDSWISPAPVQVFSDGYARVFRLTGSYTYASPHSFNLNDSNGRVYFGIVPWADLSDLSIAEVLVNKEDFVNDVIFPPIGSS